MCSAEADADAAPVSEENLKLRRKEDKTGGDNDNHSNAAQRIGDATDGKGLCIICFDDLWLLQISCASEVAFSPGKHRFVFKRVPSSHFRREWYG